MSARFAHPPFHQGALRQADGPSRFIGSSGVVPPADGQNSFRSQSTQKYLPRINRVETVFTQSKSARARRRPSIDQAHLDDIERLPAARQPASPFVGDKANAGNRRKVCEVEQTRILQLQIYKYLVYLNRRDLLRTKKRRR